MLIGRTLMSSANRTDDHHQACRSVPIRKHGCRLIRARLRAGTIDSVTLCCPARRRACLRQGIARRFVIVGSAHLHPAPGANQTSEKHAGPCRSSTRASDPGSCRLREDDLCFRLGKLQPHHSAAVPHACVRLILQSALRRSHRAAIYAPGRDANARARSARPRKVSFSSVGRPP